MAERLEAANRVAFDVVLLDAYVGDGIPQHLTTPKFFASVWRLLATSGVAILNIGVRDPVEERRIASAFRGAFNSCVLLRVLEEENLVLLGAHRRLPDTTRLLAAAERLDESLQLEFRLDIIARSHSDCESSKR